MNTNFKKQKDFFTIGWLVYTLNKLALADTKDIHPNMLTKIRIHEIERKITVEVRRASTEIMGQVEKELYWEEGSLEREPEKKQ